MPRIQEYTQQTDASSAGIPAGRSAQAGDTFALGPELGAAVGNVADKLQDAENRQEVADVHTRLAQARAEWTVNLDERARQTAPGDPTFAEKFREDFGKYLATMEGGLQTRAGQDAFRRGAGDLSAHFLEKAGVYQAQSIGAKAKQDYLVSLDAYRNTLLTDPTQFEGVAKSAGEALNDPNGPYARMSAADREALGIQTRKELALSMVQGVTRLSPDLAIRQLTEGRWDSYLDADKKAALLNSAVNAHESQLRERNAETERLRKERERLDRDTQDATFKDAMDAAAKGRLTIGWIQSNRDKIAKADYDNLIKLAAKGGGLTDGEGNKQVYADLRVKAGRGEDVRADAKQALLKGNINAGQFSAITGEVETNSATVRSENWYRTGKDLISRSLAPSQINPGIDREVQARALDDWQRYSAENPKATPQERDRVLNGIINSSRIVRSDDVLTSIPTPAYLTGTKQDPDIAATIRKTKEAFDRGEISQYEYDREGRNIQQLNRWKKQNPTPAAKPETKGK